MYRPPVVKVGGTRKWALTKLSEEDLEAALEVANWTGRYAEQGQDIRQLAKWLRGIMQQVCNVAMLRTKSRPRLATYWWTDEIAVLRRLSVQAQRRLKRLRPREDPEGVEEVLAAHSAAKYALCQAIWKSRVKCWDELLRSLNTDPWGRPYKIVINKDRLWTPPVTKSLEPHVLNNVDVLFPTVNEDEALNRSLEINGPLNGTRTWRYPMTKLSRLSGKWCQIRFLDRTEYLAKYGSEP